MPQAELERYWELFASLQLRTTNTAGRYLSTGHAIGNGRTAGQGLGRVPKGVLGRPTVNRHLSMSRLDQPHVLREPPAVRFQARHSNDCGQFDMSPSDLEHIDKPD